MLTLKIFTVFDSKAETFMPPFTMETKGLAIRNFQDLVNNPQTIFCNHSEDFTLFEIGEFSKDKGTINMYDTKISLGVGIEFKKELKNEVSLIQDS